jgi:hypothetical protein
MGRGLTLQALGELIYLDVVGLFGFRALHAVVVRTPIRATRVVDTNTTDVIAAIRRATLFYFKPTKCLQRSAVATRILRRHGIAAELVIGCLPVPLASHAWVEVSGQVVCEDRPRLRHYRVIDRW